MRLLSVDSLMCFCPPILVALNLAPGLFHLSSRVARPCCLVLSCLVPSRLGPSNQQPTVLWPCLSMVANDMIPHRTVRLGKSAKCSCRQAVARVAHNNLIGSTIESEQTSIKKALRHAIDLANYRLQHPNENETKLVSFVSLPMG